ncbi:hypothetical protein ACH5RR_035832 [Cinchona calisaya]|uniref:Pyrrolo-quinoline quinone repeat domain-containing protein n=1 Tax=Cinchona calisaya TaxID=153742 RepID=A0ABD2Y2L0_9GENT
MSINLETLVSIRIGRLNLTAQSWLNHGGDLTNRRNAVGEFLINPTTVRYLRLKWRFIAGFDISATPAVANGVVYFPSWNGYLYAKSGFAWALDRDNGDIVWFKRAGPGSIQGGGIWGAATDGQRVYTNIINGDRLPFTLAPSAQTTTAGAWVALDANTGEVLWSTANPSNETSPGPMTIVNGLLFAGCVAPNGPFYAMNAKTGDIVWSYNTGATIYGGGLG